MGLEGIRKCFLGLKAASSRGVLGQALQKISKNCKFKLKVHFPQFSVYVLINFNVQFSSFKP